jgi:exodeoxyribonuclease VII small subunit
MAKKKKDSLKYGEARDKLEEILKAIDGNEVDVDDLADKVREAAELIQVCRRKLQKTRVEVEKVVSEMNLEDEDAKSTEPGEPAAEDAGEEGSDDAPF